MHLFYIEYILHMEATINISTKNPKQLLFQVPSMFLNYLGSDIDWKYHTEPEDNACLGEEGRKCYWPRGKVLGGTSVINGMMYIRGSRRDFDSWAEAGNAGWSYNEVLPYFLKSEDNQQMDEMDRGYHATGGYLTVTRFPYHPPLSSAILEAGRELGYESRDVNGERHTGFMIAQTTTRNGSRLSTAKAFLRPVLNERPNLHVLLNSTATKVLIDPSNKRAYGVEFIRDNVTHRVYARKEIVVSGGAVNSPQLLLLSGVGPKEDLSPLGINVVHDLPGVGRNLHNHVAYFVGFTMNDTDTRPLNWATAMEYLLYRDGLMAGTGISETTALINTKYADPAADHPDMQVFFGGYLADCAKTGQVGEMGGENVNASRYVIMFPALLHPKSRGQIKLKSADPLAAPAIYARYLSEPEDVKRLVEGIKFAVRLGETQALKRYGFKLDSTKVKGCEKFTFNTDAYWECAVRYKTGPENHQAGSCKMAPASDPDAVVDSELRVYGVAGLRVADASIMPVVTSGNTNAPAIMIAEKAADSIKATWLSRKTYTKAA